MLRFVGFDAALPLQPYIRMVAAWKPIFCCVDGVSLCYGPAVGTLLALGVVFNEAFLMDRQMLVLNIIFVRSRGVELLAMDYISKVVLQCRGTVRIRAIDKKQWGVAPP